MFSEDILNEEDFFEELKEVYKSARRLKNKLKNLRDEWELDEEDEELLQELQEQAETLQQDLYDSFNEEEDEED